MNSKWKLAFYFLVGGIAGMSGIVGFAFKPAADDDSYSDRGDRRAMYKWYPPELPKNVDFAGEKVPMGRWEVRERLDREMMINYYMHGTTLYILKLSTRYFPYIEERLKANGIPDDFKYVCVAESALQQSAASPVGAASYWQFMKESGQHYGLEVNDNVDERYNLKKATEAACLYYKDAYNKFGSWTACAASYNCGITGYANQVEFQGGRTFYDMAFPEETNRYVFRIVAIKYLMMYAKSYGFMLSGADTYKPMRTRIVTVDKTIINLSDFAKENGSSYKLLKLLNPWLRSHTLPVKPGKTYQIELPEERE